MSPEKRITKRQMKQDNFIATALKASEYVQQRKNYFLGGLAVVIAAIAIIYFINFSITQKTVNAENLFGKAQIASAMNQPTLAINDFKSIINDYGSTRSADRACYYLARILFDQEELDSALVYFEMYIEKYGRDKMLLAAAYNGAAICLENKDDYLKAGEYFMKAAQTANDEIFSPDYYMNAGRAFYAAGQRDNAASAYQYIVDNYRRSTQYSMARKKLAEVQYDK